ncbi:MAG: nuclear transport factor 2 family protein [SAR202 cluster bacterium]|nr:hypothetical protein [Chloroflexota bacterium]MDP6421957.1 nuclear transport factor 2 family protein [SAR202 cluster bacterium]HAL49421.1 hypothetical protein [Dehalococcoidia bacterium]MDP6662681.1 nuclear transport factor 2 family protein [SAR202 cluster bacterium]MDP6799468.1 nuclear transport factor 2 family protein [SAR202 cluster bacterium]
MDDQSPEAIVRAFVDHVNGGNLAGIASLLSDDIVFIDASGNVHRRDKSFMAGYLAQFPEYRIHVHGILLSGNGVAIIGQTTGSHVSPQVEANETIVWAAEVRDGLIAEWRIYAESE